MGKLEGMIAMVTGAHRGIGRAIALEPGPGGKSCRCQRL